MTHLLCLLNLHAWGAIQLPPPGMVRVTQFCTRPGCPAFHIKLIPNTETPSPALVAKLASSHGWSETYTHTDALAPGAYGGHTGKKLMPPGLHPMPPRTMGPFSDFHGGNPGFDPTTQEGKAKLQEMLPQGSASSVAGDTLPLVQGTPCEMLAPCSPEWQQLHRRPACREAANAQVSVEESSPDAYEPEPPGKDAAFQTYVNLTTKLMEELQVKLKATLAFERVRQDRKDRIFAHVAETLAELGTCCRLKVGCLMLTKEGRLAGGGYNGAGPGMPHCHPDTCNTECRCGRTMHAEQNALFARSGDPYTAYVTAEPCLNCTKELAVAGVRRVVYIKPYTSIAENERHDRQEWIDHYHIEWKQLPQGEPA